MIWRLRNERVIQEQEDVKMPEIQNQDGMAGLIEASKDSRPQTAL
jgi:hypothetical protein